MNQKIRELLERQVYENMQTGGTGEILIGGDALYSEYLRRMKKDPQYLEKLKKIKTAKGRLAFRKRMYEKAKKDCLRERYGIAPSVQEKKLTVVEKKALNKAVEEVTKNAKNISNVGENIERTYHRIIYNDISNEIKKFTDNFMKKYPDKKELIKKIFLSQIEIQKQRLLKPEEDIFQRYSEFAEEYENSPESIGEIITLTPEEALREREREEYVRKVRSGDGFKLPLTAAERKKYNNFARAYRYRYRKQNSCNPLQRNVFNAFLRAHPEIKHEKKVTKKRVTKKRKKMPVSETVKGLRKRASALGLKDYGKQKKSVLKARVEKAEAEKKSGGQLYDKMDLYDIYDDMY